MKIFVLADDASPLVDQLRELGYPEVTCMAALPALHSPILDDVELVLVDVNEGVDLEQLIHLRYALPLPILLLIGTTDEQVLIDAYRAGIDDHMGKPLSSAMLHAKLQVWQRWVGQLHAVH